MSNHERRGLMSIEKLLEQGIISPLSYAATQSVMRLSGETDARVGVALALAQTALNLGHLGLRLNAVAEDFSPEVIKELKEREHAELDDDQLSIKLDQLNTSQDLMQDWSSLPETSEWLECLKQSPSIWWTGRGKEARPFVLDGEVLFTLKAWRGESRVAHALHQLSMIDVGTMPRPSLLWQRLFADSAESWFDGGAQWDRSKLALYSAFRSSVMIIHGGPGTGKTTLTQRILAALIEQYAQADDPLRIVVTAPTGKAAQRLTESIQARASFFHLPDEIQEQLARLQGLTLHSLLGIAPGRSPEHHRMNPLSYDVIVVDECSMVDMWLLQSLLEAIVIPHDRKSRCRLLLIGDPQQLPSVSAGAPFSELCADRGPLISAERLNELDRFITEPNKITHESDADVLKEATILSDSHYNTASTQSLIERLDMRLSEQTTAPSSTQPSDLFIDRVVALNQVRRVAEDSGIHAAASAMQNVEALGVEAVIQSFQSPKFSDTEYYAGPPFPQHLFDEVVQYAQKAISLAKINPHEALVHLKSLCLLSPHYGGSLGVNELNEAVESKLRELRIGGWGRGYVGRPILITQNHPPTGLVNGDIGIVGRDHQVYFENHEKAVSLSLLPPHRTVFAMSIHKSQGSEFQKIIMCIPPERSPIMTRELIYTGLTRAKKHAILVGNLDVLSASILAQVERGGQLSNRLTRLAKPIREL